MVGEACASERPLVRPLRRCVSERHSEVTYGLFHVLNIQQTTVSVSLNSHGDGGENPCC